MEDDLGEELAGGSEVVEFGLGCEREDVGVEIVCCSDAVASEL